MTSQSRSAIVRVPCDSPQQAQRLLRALSIEAASGPSRRRVSLAAEGVELVLTFQADDTRGLRAATNSFLRWTQTALEVDRIAVPGSESFKPRPRSGA